MLSSVDRFNLFLGTITIPIKVFGHGGFGSYLDGSNLYWIM